MCRNNPRNRRRKGIEPPSQGDNPSVSAEVVERFAKVGILETYL
jgi:hypothetical protein